MLYVRICLYICVCVYIICVGVDEKIKDVMGGNEERLPVKI